MKKRKKNKKLFARVNYSLQFLLITAILVNLFFTAELTNQNNNLMLIDERESAYSNIIVQLNEKETEIEKFFDESSEEIDNMYSVFLGDYKYLYNVSKKNIFDNFEEWRYYRDIIDEDTIGEIYSSLASYNALIDRKLEPVKYENYDKDLVKFSKEFAFLFYDIISDYNELEACYTRIAYNYGQIKSVAYLTYIYQEINDYPSKIKLSEDYVPNFDQNNKTNYNMFNVYLGDLNNYSDLDQYIRVLGVSVLIKEHPKLHDIFLDDIKYKNLDKNNMDDLEKVFNDDSFIKKVIDEYYNISKEGNIYFDIAYVNSRQNSSLDFNNMLKNYYKENQTFDYTGNCYNLTDEQYDVTNRECFLDTIYNSESEKNGLFGFFVQKSENPKYCYKVVCKSDLLNFKNQFITEHKFFGDFEEEQENNFYRLSNLDYDLKVELAKIKEKYQLDSSDGYDIVREYIKDLEKAIELKDKIIKKENNLKEMFYKELTE